MSGARGRELDRLLSDAVSAKIMTVRLPPFVFRLNLPRLHWYCCGFVSCSSSEPVHSVRRPLAPQS
jgi:hypothetical protein